MITSVMDIPYDTYVVAPKSIISRYITVAEESLTEHPYIAPFDRGKFE